MQNRIEQINITNQNIARGVEENICLALTEADTVLQLIKLEMENQGYIDAKHEKMFKKLSKSSVISSIGGTDVEGNIIFSFGGVMNAQNTYK